MKLKTKKRIWLAGTLEDNALCRLSLLLISQVAKKWTVSDNLSAATIILRYASHLKEFSHLI